MKKFEQIDFTVAEHFLPAMINGDISGLSDDDAQWWAEFSAWVIEQNGNGHWSHEGESEASFRRCEVTGLFSSCVDVAYMREI